MDSSVSQKDQISFLRVCHNVSNVLYSKGVAVSTRTLMCHGSWELWVHGVSAIICMPKLIIVMSMVSYYVCCRMIRTYIYLSYTYKMCNNIQECGFCNVNKNPNICNSMQIFIYCKVTLHVSGVTAHIISTKNCNRSLRYRS